MGTVGGVVLAAGRGKRMGAAKLRLEASGVSYLARCVRTLDEGGARPVVCVVGEEDAEWARREASGATILTNSDPARGMLSSVKIGLTALDGCEGIVVFPVDHPEVAARTVRALIREFRESVAEAGALHRKRTDGSRAVAAGGRDVERPGDTPPAVVKPVWDGRSGHPVLIGAALFPGVRAAADDETLRGIIASSGLPVRSLAVEDPGIVRNINTPEDRDQLRRDER